MTIYCSLYGGYINNVFFASTNSVWLRGTMNGMRLLSGSSITITELSAGDEYRGTITGEYITNNTHKGTITANISGVVYQIYNSSANDLLKSVNEYDLDVDEVFVKYTTPVGKIAIANTTDLQIWAVSMDFHNVNITTTFGNVVNDGVYSLVKQQLNEISYDMLGKSISALASELYDTPEHIRSKINVNKLFNNPAASNSLETFSEADHKQKIKARMIRDYDMYHYYLYKIPVGGMSNEAAMKLYRTYAKTYDIDILQYDGEILGLYIISRR